MLNATRKSVNHENQGEIEAAICERVTRFEQEYMGRGPKDIHTHMLSVICPWSAFRAF